MIIGTANDHSILAQGANVPAMCRLEMTFRSSGRGVICLVCGL